MLSPKTFQITKNEQDFIGKYNTMQDRLDIHLKKISEDIHVPTCTHLRVQGPRASRTTRIGRQNELQANPRHSGLISEPSHPVFGQRETLQGFPSGTHFNCCYRVSHDKQRLLKTYRKQSNREAGLAPV